MNINGLHPVYVGTGHCVELIVEQEMPPVFAAFRMSGLAISHVNLSSNFSNAQRFALSFLDGRSLD
jgi:Broad-minded protein